MERTGGCQCGKVRYACPAEPIDIYICHCTACRAQSASAFGVSYCVPAEKLRVTRGEPRFYNWTVESGTHKRGAFCGDCGTRLWHESGSHDTEPSIKGGSLDEPVDLTDAIHIWTRSKLPGIVIPNSCRQYPEEPE